MRVSIIVPVFNVEEHIAECIESILDQDFGDFELILVDDGATDDSGVVCDAYAKRDGRVRVLHNRNGGPSAARNAGLDVACGEFVQFVDADDVLLPGACGVLNRLSGEIDLLVAGAELVDGSGSHLREIATLPVGTHVPERLLARLDSGSKAALLHYVWNKWYRRSVVEASGLRFAEDVHLGEDFLFNCSFLRCARLVAALDAVIYRYYVRNEASLTRRFRGDELSRRRVMDAALVDLFEHFGLREEHRRTLDGLVALIALESLSTVTLPGCDLSYSDRIRFLDEFMESEYGPLISQYAGGASRLQRVECRLVQARAPRSLYALLKLAHSVRAARRWRNRHLRRRDCSGC